MKLRQFYRFAVWTFLITVAMLMLLNIATIAGMEPFENLPFAIRLPLGLLGAFAAVGIVTVWFGMIWNCAVASRLPIFSRIGWLLLIVFTNMLGTLIYYFVVFQKQAKAPKQFNSYYTAQ